MTQTATTITVDSLPIANSIDPVQDRALIYTASATDIQGISRNVYLGLSSQPVGINDSQTLTTKVLDNTNSLTIKAVNLVIQDATDTTKQAKFIASGITTGNTRSYTLPDYNATLATLAGTETLTNKTLTSPTLNTPTISNASITADVLSGYTTAGSGTIYGLGVASGAFTTSNIINTAAIQASAVTNSKIATSTIAASKLVGLTLFGVANAIIGSPPTPTGQFYFQAGTTVGVFANNALDIPFPTTFPNGVLSVVVCGGDSGNGAGMSVSQANISVSSFRAQSASNGAQRVNWSAIGF